MSNPYAPTRTPPPLVTDDQLHRELAFIDEYEIDHHDRWIKTLLDTLKATEHRPTQDKFRAALVARLAPYHAWHDKVPFTTVEGLDRGGIRLGEQFSDHSPVTLGAELEHILIYGPTGSGKSALVAHLIKAILENA